MWPSASLRIQTSLPSPDLLGLIGDVRGTANTICSLSGDQTAQGGGSPSPTSIVSRSATSAIVRHIGDDQR